MRRVWNIYEAVHKEGVVQVSVCVCVWGGTYDLIIYIYQVVHKEGVVQVCVSGG